MDNLGDWIYIVFLVIAAVSGLFSSKGKKKRPTQVLGQPEHDMFPEEQTPSGKGFWEILEEAAAAPQQKMPVKEKSSRPLKDRKAEKRTPSPFLTAEQEIQKSKVSSSTSMTFPTEEETSVLQDIEFNNAEELRKAVIYSEILNRKY